MASFNKYSGAFTPLHLAHLLRRTTYGVSLETVKELRKKSLGQVIDTLFTPQALPQPPINVSYTTDPDVPIGTTWVDKGNSANVNNYRRASLKIWQLELLMSKQPNITEKLTIFWHNHFVTADINDPRYSYLYITLLRQNALGNFKQLTKDITIDIAMLYYLNGRENTRTAPNENFARELMELFTLGKGVEAGPGDYTTFTETDVKEIAKALTGWVDVRALPLRVEYRANRHTTTDKTLSHRFNNIVIKNEGEDEYKKVIDIIFDREETALHISRKLYRWFVGSNIDQSIEDEIIIPMAELLRKNNYEIAEPLKALLSCEHFYDACNIGNMIKNPVDFILTPLNQFEVTLPDDLALKERLVGKLFTTSANMQMGLFEAPSVAGWAAYYQTPNYYRLWLNATSLPSRKTYTDALASVGIAQGTFRLKIDAFKWLSSIATPNNPNQLMDELILTLFSNPLAVNQYDYIKTILTGGVTDSAWTDIYDGYIADPTSVTKKNLVNTRITSLIVYMMRMPEYHLS